VADEAFGVIFLVSQFLQSVMGYTPLGAGVHGLPWTAAPAVAAPIAGLLSDRIGGRRIVAIGVALQAIGIGWLAAEITPTIGYADLIPPFLIAGAGLGFFFAPITRLTLGYAPGPLEGIASGTSYAAPGRHRAGHRRARIGLLRRRRPGQPGPVHHRPDHRPHRLGGHTRSQRAGGHAGPGDPAGDSTPSPSGRHRPSSAGRYHWDMTP